MEKKKKKHRNKYRQYLFMHAPSREITIKLPGCLMHLLGLFLLRKRFTKYQSLILNIQIIKLSTLILVPCSKQHKTPRTWKKP